MILAQAFDQSAVEFLWKCKLKSRASFLTILEFVNLGTDLLKRDVRSMLILVAPRGICFFASYVKFNLVITNQINKKILRGCQFQ
jgi:hypothetical protein